MKGIFLALVLTATFAAEAQESLVYRDRDRRFELAKEYYQKEQYNLAYPILKELQQRLTPQERANNPQLASEVEYYAIATALGAREDRAAYEAEQYIATARTEARAGMMRFHLAEFRFAEQKFDEALTLYEGVDVTNLDNQEIARMKFHQGYSYFTLKQYAQAKPLLNSIRQIRDDPNYIDANYYYAFILFRDRQYSDALQGFRIVENAAAYEATVPYYIAQILYVQGQKEEAIRYAEAKLAAGKAKFYDLELKQLLGHAYFEKKQYSKALPYLQEYVERSGKVRREDLYELAYAQYHARRYDRAIEGFKQLSGGEDSLAQHAMYLLGDAYLKTGKRSEARNAFLFSSTNNSNATQREISRFNYAKLSYELGYQDEGLRSLQTFLNDYPRSTYYTEAADLLVGALANTNNYRDALQLLETLQTPSAASRRLTPKILFGRATELINDGALTEADALLDRALRDPQNGSVLPLVHFWKGEIDYRNGRLDEALQHYNSYLSVGAPTAGEATARTANYALGYIYHRKENYPVAKSFFEPLSRNAALASEPITQDAYVRTADAYFMAKDFVKAREMYDRVIGWSWAAEDYATFQKAMILGIRTPAEKIANLNTLIRKFPASSLVGDANMEIANTYLSNESYREAVPYLQTLVKSSYNNLKPLAYLNLGVAYYNLNNNGEAISQFNQVIRQYPASAEAEDALENLRTIYIETGRPGDYAEAARAAGRPLSTSAEDSLTFAAAELQYTANSPVALASLESYLSKFPSGANALEAHFYVAEIYNLRKNAEAALPHYTTVADQAPNPWAERSALIAARAYFFDKKDYVRSEKYFRLLSGLTGSGELRLEAARGLLRSQYQLKKWSEAAATGRDLVLMKGSTADDKALSQMAIARGAAERGDPEGAATAYRAVIANNKAALAAEARYEIAAIQFVANRLKEAEKSAFEVINRSGSYGYWVTKAYILLGDIYGAQGDYFNAKATYQSVVENADDPSLKSEAQNKLAKAQTDEARNSKVEN